MQDFHDCFFHIFAIIVCLLALSTLRACLLKPPFLYFDHMFLSLMLFTRSAGSGLYVFLQWTLWRWGLEFYFSFCIIEIMQAISYKGLQTAGRFSMKSPLLLVFA